MAPICARVGEAAAADGQLVYAAEPAPGVEMKRTQGRPSVEEALSSWYETLGRMEEEDLGLVRNRNGREIPWRLRNAEEYDIHADALRRAFVASTGYTYYKIRVIFSKEESERM